MDIAALATGLATIIAAAAAGMSVWVKSLNERNSITIKNLEESNAFLQKQIKDMRRISADINKSYESIVTRVKDLEHKNLELVHDNHKLSAENRVLKERIVHLEKYIKSSPAEDVHVEQIVVLEEVESGKIGTGK